MKNRRPRKYWSFEKCQLEAAMYDSINEWRKYSQYSYKAAYKNGWTESISNHMTRERQKNNYWSLDKCKESAFNYNTKKEWISKCVSAYNAAWKNGWLNECCNHMIKIKNYEN